MTLICAITSLIECKTDAHVLHVPGVDNVIADALSHFKNTLALQLVPGICVGLFETLLVMLEAAKK